MGRYNTHFNCRLGLTPSPRLFSTTGPRGGEGVRSFSRPAVPELQLNLSVCCHHSHAHRVRKAPRVVLRPLTSFPLLLVACMCCLLPQQCQQHLTRDSPHVAIRGGVQGSAEAHRQGAGKARGVHSHAWSAGEQCRRVTQASRVP